jgi:hypothetical protein
MESDLDLKDLSRLLARIVTGQVGDNPSAAGGLRGQRTKRKEDQKGKGQRAEDQREKGRGPKAGGQKAREMAGRSDGPFGP